MRRMPTILQLDNFALLYVALYPVNLPKSTIFIINALQRQQWTANRSNFFFDRPLAKRRMQADIVPAPED